jgi:stage II sporulation protein D
MRHVSLILIIVLCQTFNIHGEDKPSGLLAHFNREIPLELFTGNLAKIGANGEGVLECYRGVKLSEIYYFSSSVNIINRENGIEIDDEDGLVTLGLAEVRCKPRLPSTVMTYSGNAYRGYIKAIYQDTTLGMQVLNIVDIEDYLKGVLPGEIGHRTDDEYEAVKAQAVASRTYAIWKLTDRETSGKLASTVADQLYTGKDMEMPLLSKAVDETSGEIITFKGRPIAAYYHAVCGGYTSPIEKTWSDKKPIPYLEGVDDDSNCVWAKSYSWIETFTSDSLKANLKNYFTSKNAADSVNFDKIEDIDFVNDPETGRVDTMKVTTGQGTFFAADDKIRWALGRQSVAGTILPSTRFKAEKEMKDGKLVGLILSGTGNGHGVGMCQCGAIGQARAGQKYDDILKFYYRHTKLEKLY